MSYRYDFHSVFETSEHYTAAIVNPDLNVPYVENLIKQTFYDHFTDIICQEFLKHTPPVIVGVAVLTNCEVHVTNVAPVGFPSYKATVTCDYWIQTATPLSASPIGDWVFDIIYWILQAVVILLIAYWTIQAIKDWLISMTTTTTTTTEYDANGHPIKTTKTTNPSVEGIATVIIVGAVVIVGGLLAYTYIAPKLGG